MLSKSLDSLLMDFYSGCRAFNKTAKQYSASRSNEAISMDLHLEPIVVSGDYTVSLESLYKTVITIDDVAQAEILIKQAQAEHIEKGKEQRIDNREKAQEIVKASRNIRIALENKDCEAVLSNVIVLSQYVDFGCLDLEALRNGIENAYTVSRNLASKHKPFKPVCQYFKSLAEKANHVLRLALEEKQVKYPLNSFPEILAKGLFAEGEDLDLQKSRRYSFYEVAKTSKSVERAYESVRKNQILQTWEPNTAFYMTMNALYDTEMKLTPKEVSKLIRTYGRVPFHTFNDLAEIVSQTIRNFDREKMSFKELIKSIEERLVGNTSMLEKNDYEIVLGII